MLLVVNFGVGLCWIFVLVVLSWICFVNSLLTLSGFGWVFCIGCLLFMVGDWFGLRFGWVWFCLVWVCCVMDTCVGLGLMIKLVWV